jgi:prephenate dehydrogenase
VRRDRRRAGLFPVRGVGGVQVRRPYVRGQRELVGQGVRDVTRVAAGDPALWADIVRANAPAVAAVLRDIRGDLTRLLAAVEVLTEPAADGQAEALRALTGLLERGAAGTVRTRPAAARTRLRVVLGRAPGDLGRLLRAAAPYGAIADPAGTTVGDDGHLVVHLEVPEVTATSVATELAVAGWAVDRPVQPAAASSP